MNIRVVLADDHALVRAGLRELLELKRDITVVAEAGDGQAAVEAVAATAPQVVVMDASMPGMCGIEATRRIVHDTPGTRVLCLSMHAERRFVCEILRIGASGYVLKDATASELVCAIRTIAAGQKYVSPAVTGVVLDALVEGLPADDEEPEIPLTRRENEILQLLAEGHSTKRIAHRLGVSAKTVATHREHLHRKLGLDSIAGLTKYAIRHGLTTVDRQSST